MDYFPLLSFLLYLTEHIRVAPIWVEFKINQRGCRVSMSTVGMPALPDWRSSCPCQQTVQQVGYTKPDIFMDLVRKRTRGCGLVLSVSVLSVSVMLPLLVRAQSCLGLCAEWAGTSHSWGLGAEDCTEDFFGDFLKSIRRDLQSVREAEGVIPFKTVPHVPLFWQFFIHQWIFWAWSNARNKFLDALAVTLKLLSVTCNSPRSWWRSYFKRSIGCFETGLSQSFRVPIPEQSLGRTVCKYLDLPLSFVCLVKGSIHPCFKRILRIRLLYDKGNPVNNLLGNKIWYLFLECCFNLIG